jgi:cytochrome c oxidase subunit II
MRRGLPARLCATALLAACTGPQHMLDTRGPAAEQIAGLWWLILSFAVATSIIIPALLLVAVSRARRRGRGHDIREIDGRRLVWIGGVTIPAILLGISLVASYRLSNTVYQGRPVPADALTIEVVGHQFWWEVRYPEYGVVTANEFLIPVGRPIRLRLASADVIHSFWVPQLHGKLDMIPGRTNDMWVRADSAGEFRGQCAEYCGMSHALMALWITAVEPTEFAAWLQRAAARAAERATAAAVEPLAEHGRRVFADAGCGHCHGTPDAPLPPRLAAAGPDLGEFGARRTIGAGRMANTAENLAAWITDPQALKPGNNMPGTTMPPDEMRALVTYLYTLR